jgi:hypothetical protein
MLLVCGIAAVQEFLECAEEVGIVEGKMVSLAAVVQPRFFIRGVVLLVD